MTANEYLKSIQDNFDGIDKNLEQIQPVTANEFIPKSVIEDIKAEMRKKFWPDEAERAIDVIDKHISGKENCN